VTFSEKISFKKSFSKKMIILFDVSMEIENELENIPFHLI